VTRTLYLAAVAATLYLTAGSRADDLKEAESVLSKSGSPAGSLKVSALERSKGLTDNDVVGTWKGKSTQGDNTISLDLIFEDDGTVSNKASNGLSGRGTWKIDGETIEVTWSTGAKVRWTVEDGSISGKGTTSRGQPWSIHFKKQ
jgi:hypothetical protein